MQQFLRAVSAALAVVVGCPVPALAQTPPPPLLTAEPASFSATVFPDEEARFDLAIRATGAGELGIAAVTVEGIATHHVSDACTGRAVSTELPCFVYSFFRFGVPGRYEGHVVVTPETGVPLRVPVVVDVLANAGLRYSTTLLDFGDVVVGTKSAPRTLTITNGYKDMWLVNVYDPIEAEFVADYWPPCTNNYPLEPGGSCVLTYRFAPTKVGVIEAQVVVDIYDTKIRPVPVTLRGRGVAAAAPPVAVLDATSGPEGQTLPRTGREDVSLLASAGAALVLLGTVLLSRGRRSRTAVRRGRGPRTAPPRPS